jgi:hypothetical protein
LVLPSLHAQPVFDDDVNDVPIDGGLSLLVAAGVGYRAKKLKNRKNTIPGLGVSSRCWLWCKENEG